MILNLKFARMKKKLTQDELCSIVGISRKNLSDLENGKGNPRLDTMKKLSKALDSSIVDLFLTEEE